MVYTYSCQRTERERYGVKSIVSSQMNTICGHSIGKASYCVNIFWNRQEVDEMNRGKQTTL